MAAVLAIQTVLVSFSIVFSLLRFYVRWILMKMLRLDDVLSLLALV